MAYTISVHHGGGKANRGHNIREASAIKNQHHIDERGHHETWKDETEAKAYRRIFGKAQEEYNSRQKRKDRKIKSYHAEVEKNTKMHTSYECIVQIGSLRNQVDEEIERKILRQFYEEWEKRNPNMELYGAYFHCDEEGGNHLHLDYIPVAHGYKKGMETQAGLVKALEEMGYQKDGRETAQMKWQEHERQALEDICKEYGLEIDHPIRDGEKRKREHLETNLYKRAAQLKETIEALEENKQDASTLQSKIKEKEQYEEQLTYSIENKEKQLGKIRGEVKEAKDFKKERKPHIWSRDNVTIPYSEYQSLRKTVKAINSLKEAVEELEKNKEAFEEEKATIQPQMHEIEQEKKRLKRLIEAQVDYIKAEAVKEVDERFKGYGNSRNRRMEDFMEEIKFSSGRSALDVFEEKEKQLKKQISLGWER